MWKWRESSLFTLETRVFLFKLVTKYISAVVALRQPRKISAEPQRNKGDSIGGKQFADEFDRDTFADPIIPYGISWTWPS